MREVSQDYLRFAILCTVYQTQLSDEPEIYSIYSLYLWIQSLVWKNINLDGEMS